MAPCWWWCSRWGWAASRPSWISTTSSTRTGTGCPRGLASASPWSNPGGSTMCPSSAWRSGASSWGPPSWPGLPTSWRPSSSDCPAPAISTALAASAPCCGWCRIRPPSVPMASAGGNSTSVSPPPTRRVASRPWCRTTGRSRCRWGSSCKASRRPASWWWGCMKANLSTSARWPGCLLGRRPQCSAAGWGWGKPAIRRWP